MAPEELRASAPDPITSPPPQSFQAYDATSEETMCGWEKINRNTGNAGPVDPQTMEVSGDRWPGGPGPWKQT